MFFSIFSSSYAFVDVVLLLVTVCCLSSCGTLAQQHFNCFETNRELKNAVDTAAINCETQMIRLEDLPQEIINAPRIQPAVENFGEDTKSQLESALQKAGGNRSKAAKLLGVSRATFYRRLIDAGIETIKKPKI